MENENLSISYHLLQDHKNLEKKLKNLINGFGMDRNTIKENYIKFKDCLEKHIFTEEQAIFAFTNFENPETQQTISNLLLEHKEIKKNIEIMDSKINTIDLEGLDDFLNLLARHLKQENEVLYPKLDRELDEEQKSFILKKINAIN